MQNKLFQRKAVILFASVLLLTGLLSSFKSSEFLSSTTDTWSPTDTGSDTDTGTDTETGKSLTAETCSIYVDCPNGTRVTANGNKSQCLGNSGKCKSADEKACDAGTPRCP